MANKKICSLILCLIGSSPVVAGRMEQWRDAARHGDLTIGDSFFYAGLRKDFAAAGGVRSAMDSIVFCSMG